MPKNAFLPDLDRLRKHRVRPKLFFLNYPNNPTAAVADLRFFRELVRFAERTHIPICHDAAYSEITFDGIQHPSFLQVPGAKEVGIEFHSLSKTFNMTGWRIGWACGNRRMIAALAKVKSNIDSGLFQAIQMAGVRALDGSGRHLTPLRRLYQIRRDLIVGALQKAGWPVKAPKATFYLWAPIPRKRTSQEVAAELLKKGGIVATPGIGFGAHGEGYIRFSLSVPTERIREAAYRLQRFSLWQKSSSL
jgi:LL-diaminopimelate aminotransferase